MVAAERFAAEIERPLGKVEIRTPFPRVPALTPEAGTAPAPIAYPANSAVNELMEYVVEAVTT